MQLIKDNIIYDTEKDYYISELGEKEEADEFFKMVLYRHYEGGHYLHVLHKSDTATSEGMFFVSDSYAFKWLITYNLMDDEPLFQLFPEQFLSSGRKLTSWGERG